jgi:hypothetical protein
MDVKGDQVAITEESYEPVTFFGDQIITSETCVLDNIAPKHQRTVPKIISKVNIILF